MYRGVLLSVLDFPFRRSFTASKIAVELKKEHKKRFAMYVSRIMLVGGLLSQVYPEKLCRHVGYPGASFRKILNSLTECR